MNLDSTGKSCWTRYRPHTHLQSLGRERYIKRRRLEQRSSRDAFHSFRDGIKNHLQINLAVWRNQNYVCKDNDHTSSLRLYLLEKLFSQ